MGRPGETASASTGGMSSVFRRVNDAIRELAERAQGDDAWSFYCECDDGECREVISLTVEQFDARRVDPAGSPLLAAVHGNGHGAAPD